MDAKERSYSQAYKPEGEGC